METIIGLLIVVLPIVFKLIGKKLEQAAQNASPQEQPVEDWVETLRRHLEAQQQMQPAKPVVEETEVVKTLLHQPDVQKVKGREVPQALEAKKTVKPVLKEEPKKKKEKIDVRKMIIYSEIMKPKY